MRARIGNWLRRTADHIHPAGAATLTGWSYTHEKRTPTDTYLLWREDGRGCPVWYMGDADLNRSFTEADSDWRTPTERTAAMFAQHGADIRSHLPPPPDKPAPALAVWTPADLTQDELDDLYTAKQECDLLGIPFLIPEPMKDTP